jgi:hypothetical protein
MVDNMNPTNQFHPYQPMSDTPASERSPGRLGANLNDALGKVREYARAKPGVVLGGLAALAIGMGLMRRR